ncbi:diguanylate cyclase [Clostridium aestuarii]|uniref:Diguanylate cyclase n=1 Tax=Clostridium aestuarii TaxID=338193 RepID=A0ABT4CWH2_9CLOT|nr:diguanylate cyclase [Clostridium aestuarii]MCY6483345.1 diguanylate cyclase [Clostridium aestuarii]
MNIIKKIVSLFKRKNRKKNLITGEESYNTKEIQQILSAFQENLEFFQILIDTIPNPIFYKDEYGIYKHCNNAFIEYVGLKRKEIIEHSVYEVYPKELADIYYKADNELMKSKGKQTYEAKLLYNDGSFHDVIFNKAVLINKQNEVKGLVGVVMDITNQNIDKKRMERLLKLKDAVLEISHAIIGLNNINELFELILEKATELMGNSELACVLVLDEDDNLKIVACKGYDAEKGKEFSINLKDSFFWIKTNGNPEKTIIINDIQDMIKTKFPVILENKEEIKVQSSISAPIIIGGKLYGLINVDSSRNHVYDESDLEIMEYMRSKIAIALNNHKLYEQIIYLSRYDKLTNVYNRRYFEELFDKHIKKTAINNEQFLLGMFDLNGLKLINDSYGHLAGDELIKTFASRLSNLIGYSDIVARFGGDEFVSIINDTDLQNTIKKIRELIKEFNDNPIRFEENSFKCSFSYGIAKFPQEGKEYDELMKIADERMYKNKQKVKNSKKYLQNQIINKDIVVHNKV